MTPEPKYVIDLDKMAKVDTFDVGQTQEKLEYYRSLGRYDFVELDRDGDIVISEEE